MDLGANQVKAFLEGDGFRCPKTGIRGGSMLCSYAVGRGVRYSPSWLGGPRHLE